MPVWHEKTKALRESGQLLVVGITQEQHPARCRLFAQWHGIDWPILWDPFNRTGSKVVPRFTLIDEHGVVRATRANPEDLEAAFLRQEFDKPAGDDPAPPGGRETLVAQHTAAKKERPALSCLSTLLWRTNGPFPDLAPLDALARERARPEHLFWLGVAHCMRHEDPEMLLVGDFSRALESWASALAMNPSQYIWRRRIQQFGPRMDKPYPFYDWVQRATTAIRARGEEPVALRTALTQSEIAGRGEVEPDTKNPDPDGKIARIKLLPSKVEVALARTTKPGANTTQVHLFIRPPAGAKWDLEATLPTLWTGVHAVRPRSRPDHRGAWCFEFERSQKPSAAYVLLPLCYDSGACKFVRVDVNLGD